MNARFRLFDLLASRMQSVGIYRDTLPAAVSLGLKGMGKWPVEVVALDLIVIMMRF